jgi:hypothetical protein
MNEIRTRVMVGLDHRISGTAPAEVPAGENQVTITLPDRYSHERPTRQIGPTDLPRHDLGPWPKVLSLRQEDIYSDDGR